MDPDEAWQVTGDVRSRQQHLLTEQIWVDCHFRVGSETNDKLIGAHKFILCLSSPVFQAMLRGGLAVNDETIHVPDVEPLIFERLLKYIYTDEVTVESVDEACQLYYAADKYIFPIVKNHCISYLLGAIKYPTVCRIYEFAKFYNLSTIVEKCLEYIKTCTKQVINDASFMELELSTIIEIFDQKYLAIETELDLYKALSKYSSHHGLSRLNNPVEANTNNKSKNSETSATNVQMESQSSNDKSTENPGHSSEIMQAKVTPNSDQNSPTIDDALRRIRFLTLTPEQLASELAENSLLSPLEGFGILMNVIIPNKSYPMPEGFSTSRLSRKPKNTITFQPPTMYPPPAVYLSGYGRLPHPY
ncbi:BTB/POZ domain-containing protein 2-like [Topomyia yanbarensis]|uniref:BTB/POZ domain-containing protein 2-like n=1 Tax=Topomyia yanbarensis TaxID=2498891 RepID=UPI00273AE44C|nr:BTB/POZ domain-containing protein 2-like [Topomyia yanbarensis]